MASLRANAVRGHSERQRVSAAYSVSMPGGLCSRDALVHIYNTCCCTWRDGGPVQGATEASMLELMRTTMHFQWRKCRTISQLRGHSERLPITYLRFTLFVDRWFCALGILFCTLTKPVMQL